MVFRARMGVTAVAALLAAAALLMAAVLVPAEPAAAATADRFGFAYVKDPTVPSGTSLPAGYQFGSWPTGLTATGGTFGTGRFQVRFPKIGVGPQGNVHVTAVADDGRFCDIMKWTAAGSDEVVDVGCFKPGGAPADTPFTVLYTYSTGTVPTTEGAYASAQVKSSGALVQSYNSTGGSVSTSLVLPAVYEVVFQGVGSFAPDPTGNVQVTGQDASGHSTRCKILQWGVSGSDAVVYVACHSPVTGTALNSDFTVSFHRERSVYASFGPPKYFGYIATPFAGETNFQYPLGFGANSWGATGSGTYIVKFPELHVKETTAHVTAFGNDAGYCTLAALWSQSGPNAEVPVACFDYKGKPDKLEFTSTFSSSQ